MTVIVNHGCIFFETGVITVTRSLLQRHNSFRIIKVTFCLRAAAELVLTKRIEVLVYSEAGRVKALIVMIAYILFNFLKANTANTAYCICKIFFYNILGNSNCFENLSRLVRLNCRNSHLCSNLYNAVNNSLVVVVDCSVIILVQNLLVNEFGNCFVSKVRIDCTGTVAKTHCSLMNVANLGSLQND